MELPNYIKVALACAPNVVDCASMVHADLKSMIRCVTRHTDGVSLTTALPRISISRMQRAISFERVYDPMVCLVLQGTKQVQIGNRVIRFGPGQTFIASLELPVSGRVLEASVSIPYISIALTLDRDIIADILSAMPSNSSEAAAGFGVSRENSNLLSAWSKLLTLLDDPNDIPILAPLRERELLYRLLQSAEGQIIKQTAQEDSRLYRVRQVIRWLRAHITEPIKIETLADIAGMSTSTFHRHFKAATAMTPLQFQKRLRLQTSRQLLANGAAASRAAYSVGYASTSQFSREYSRMFGLSPLRDAARLRDTSTRGSAF